MCSLNVYCIIGRGIMQEEMTLELVSLGQSKFDQIVG